MSRDCYAFLMKFTASHSPSPIKPPELLNKLQAVHLLPVLPGSKKRVLLALHHLNSNAHRVALACSQDPVMQFQLWCHANQKLSDSGNELHHLEHGISLLGMTHIENFVHNCTELNTPNPEYLEVLIQSDLAAKIVTNLLPNGASDRELYGAATRFLRWSEWILWHHYSAQVAQKLSSNLRGYPINRVDRELFGGKLHHTITNAARHLPLPSPLLGTLLQPRRPILQLLARSQRAEFHSWLENHQTEERLFSDRSLTLLLANELAKQLCEAPSGRHTQRAIKLMAAQTHQTTQQVSQAAHQALRQIQLPLSSYPHPAARLLQHWDIRCQTNQISAVKRPAAESKPAIATRLGSALKAQKPVNKTPPSHRHSPVEKGPALNQQQLTEQLHTLTQAGVFQNLHQLLDYSLKVTSLTLGFRKVVMFVVNPKNQQLHSHNCFGLPTDDPLRKLVIDLQNHTHQSVLPQLLSKPSSLVVTASNMTKLKHRLPKALYSHLQSDQSLLMSLFNNRRPVALVQATHDCSIHPLKPAIKQLQIATNESICQLAADQQALNLASQKAAKR